MRKMFIKRILFNRLSAFIVISCLFFFLNSLTGFSLDNKEGTINISPKEAYDLIQQHMEDSKLIILDLQPLENWQEERIEGALNYQEIVSTKTLKSISRNKDQVYLIYSQNVLDNDEVTSILQNIGIEKAYQLEGGIDAWIEENLPTAFAKTIKPAAAFELIKENQKNPDFIIIDLRPNNQWQRQQIKKSINKDFTEEEFSDYLDEADKNKIYLIHCQKGARGEKALPVMRERGFKYIYHLQGGINNWIAEGLPTEEHY